MKKLLLLSMLISFNSYGETLVCSYKYNGVYTGNKVIGEREWSS